MITTRSIRQQILDLFNKKRNSTIVTLYTKTKPGLKSGCPFPNLVKVSRVNCMVNTNYSKALAKMGKIVNQRPWGKRLTHSIINHKSQSYLEVRPLLMKSVYLDGAKEIPYNQIKYYLREFSGLQTVPLRTYKIDNIIGIKNNGCLLVNKGEEQLINLLNS